MLGEWLPSQALFEFDDVEKIKVIGSTYMAACGLEVNERGRVSQSRYASAELGLELFYWMKLLNMLNYAIK